MKFLLGLMFGAVAVVLVAKGVRGDDDWRARLEPVARSVAGAVENWLGSRLEIREAPSGAGAAEVAELREDAAARQPIPRPPDPRRVDEPLTRETEPATEVAPHEQVLAVASSPETPAVAPEPDPQPPRAEAPSPELPLPEAVTTRQARSALAGAPSPVQDAAAESPFRLQTVWVPFHSRMSARGFADRLMGSLNHPFAVERQGPGRYQVVFPYADEPERRALLAQAAEVTGLPL